MGLDAMNTDDNEGEYPEEGYFNLLKALNIRI